MSTQLSGRIVFSSGKQGDYDVWMLDLDASRLVQLTHGNFWNDKPRWSPDGRWVVFVSSVQGTPNIYKVPAGGGEVTPLVEDDRWNDFPAFSPDGRQLGYVSNRSGNNDLWIADANCGNPRQVTTYEGDDNSFSWMPDGKSVLFSSDREGNCDIWRLDLTSGEKQQLTVDAGMDVHPAASPDGRLIAFVSNRQFDPGAQRDEWADRDQDIWLMTASGKSPVRVTSNQNSDRCVAWSPCGRFLIYASINSGSAERLRIVDVSDLIAAYQTGDHDCIQQVAGRLRSFSLQLDRAALEAEIGSGRHPFFLTSLLPDFLARPFYGEEYFGSERYPDWIGSDGLRTKTLQAAASEAS